MCMNAEHAAHAPFQRPRRSLILIIARPPKSWNTTYVEDDDTHGERKHHNGRLARYVPLYRQLRRQSFGTAQEDATAGPSLPMFIHQRRSFMLVLSAYDLPGSMDACWLAMSTTIADA